MDFEKGDYIVNINELKAACFDFLMDLSFEGLEKRADIEVGMLAVIEHIEELGQEVK